MILFNPAHPGELIRETIDGIREESGLTLTIAEIATNLGITRKTLSAIINGKQGVTPEMALRLGAAFPNTDGEFWLKIQEQYDLAKARKQINLKKIKAIWIPKIKKEQKVATN